MAMSILTKFLNGSHSTALSTQNIGSLTLLTSYTTIIHRPGRITRKTVKHLVPSHKHNNIHLPSSTDIYAHTSWFSRIPFKWRNGLYCCTGFLFHYKLNTYHCPKCHTHHPLDPITTVTECATAKPFCASLLRSGNNPSNKQSQTGGNMQQKEKDETASAGSFPTDSVMH